MSAFSVLESGSTGWKAMVGMVLAQAILRPLSSFVELGPALPGTAGRVAPALAACCRCLSSTWRSIEVLPEMLRAALVGSGETWQVRPGLAPTPWVLGNLEAQPYTLLYITWVVRALFPFL